MAFLSFINIVYEAVTKTKNFLIILDSNVLNTKLCIIKFRTNTQKCLEITRFRKTLDGVKFFDPPIISILKQSNMN